MVYLWVFNLSRWRRLEAIWFFGAIAVGIVAGSLWETGTVFGALWWDALTAFGTVGAVISATAIPFWQYTQRINEQRVSELNAILLVAEEVQELTIDLERVAAGFKHVNPSFFKAELSRVQARLSSETLKTTDRYGRSLIKYFSSYLSAFFSVAERRILETRREDLVGGRGVLSELLVDDFSYLCTRLEELKRHSERWVDRIHKELNSFGIN